MEKQPRKLLDQVRDDLRLKHYSLRTEQSYVSWIKRYILFHDKRHPRNMGKPEIEAFLTHLAVDLRVSASTQNQAFNALLLLYRNVLHKELPDSIDSVRARRPKRLPTVMTREEVIRLINSMEGTHQFIAKLLYGGGLRLMEGVRLRVKDIDFQMNQIIAHVSEQIGHRNGTNRPPRVKLGWLNPRAAWGRCEGSAGQQEARLCGWRHPFPKMGAS